MPLGFQYNGIVKIYFIKAICSWLLNNFVAVPLVWMTARRRSGNVFIETLYVPGSQRIKYSYYIVNKWLFFFVLSPCCTQENLILIILHIFLSELSESDHENVITSPNIDTYFDYSGSFWHVTEATEMLITSRLQGGNTFSTKCHAWLYRSTMHSSVFKLPSMCVGGPTRE